MESGQDLPNIMSIVTKEDLLQLRFSPFHAVNVPVRGLSASTYYFTLGGRVVNIHGDRGSQRTSGT